MIPRAFTPAKWLARLLRRHMRYLTNVVLLEDTAGISFSLNDGEQAIAIVRTYNGRELILTNQRVLEHGRTLLQYDKVARCHWITDQPDREEKARLKRTHYHRLIVDMADGQKVVLEHLGQAVFPLLRFFESVSSEQANREDSSRR